METLELTQLDMLRTGLEILWPWISACFIGVGVVLLWLKKSGLITFGQPVERRACKKELCADHAGQTNTITAIGTRVNGLEKKIDKMDTKQDETLKVLHKLVGSVAEHHAKERNVL